MKLFELKRDIISPQFTCALIAGSFYTEQQVKDRFPNADKERLSYFFEESTTHEIRNCRIVLKQLNTITCRKEI